jgi:hypothetical protein
METKNVVIMTVAKPKDGRAIHIANHTIIAKDGTIEGRKNAVNANTKKKRLWNVNEKS